MDRAKNNIYLFIPLIIFILLSLIRLDNFCISGDEWYSIEDAQHLGRSFISIPYFLILKIMLNLFGMNEFIFRFVSIVFGSLTIVTLYFTGKILKDAKLGFILSFLGAISAFLICQSQVIRYYSLLAFLSTLSLFSFFFYLRRSNKKSLYIWIAVNVAAHFFHPGTTFLFLGEISYLLYFYKKKYFWYLGFALCFFVAIIFFLNLFGINMLSTIYTAYIKDIIVAPQPKGIHISTLIKPFFTVYTFIFGPNVNPYNFALVIPSLFFFSVLFIKGIKCKIINERHFFDYAVFLFFIPLFLLFFIAEPLSPQPATQFEPKHAIFAYPVWLIILGLGLYSLKKPVYKNICWGCLLIANLFILKEYYYPTYSYYSTRYIDFKRSSISLQNKRLEDTLFVVDGRAKGSFEFYNRRFLNNKPLMDLWTFNSSNVKDLRNYKRIILACNDYRAYGDAGNINKAYSKALSKINKYYYLEEGCVDYPFFFQSFINKENMRAIKNAAISLPAEFHGFEYADLKLPIKIYGKEILSSFLVKRGKELSLQIYKEISNDGPFLVFICNLEESALVKDDSVVGRVSIRYSDGEVNYIDLIKGVNVFDAFAEFHGEKINDDLIAHSWQKQPIITSKLIYPSIWVQHRAFLYKTAIPLKDKVIEKITINYTPDPGGLRIWAVFTRHQA